MSANDNSMTSGPIWKKIMRFAYPILLGNLFQQLYNTVDALIVGNYLGYNSLAAVSSTGSLIFMIVGFFAGIANGASIVVSKYFGAEDDKMLERAVHTMVAFGLLAGGLLTILGLIFSPQILMWMGTPEPVMKEAVTYLRIYFAGALALVMFNILIGILHAIGDSRHPLYYLMASSAINLVLDLIFIAYFGTGVGGAALATVISQLFSAILCLAHLMKTKENYRVQIQKITLDMKILKQIVKIGLPSGLQNSMIAFSNLVVQANVNAFGEMAMAGYGAYGKVEGFAFLPITSFNMALTTFVGQNLGARQYERTKKGARFGIAITVIVSALIGIPVYIFAPQFVAAFETTPEVIKFGVEKARISSRFYAILAYSHSASAVLRGAGKAIVPMLIMFIFWFGGRILFLSIAVPLTKSIQTVYWVYPLTWSLSSISLFYYYKKANWLQADI